MFNSSGTRLGYTHFLHTNGAITIPALKRAEAHRVTGESTGEKERTEREILKVQHMVVVSFVMRVMMKLGL